MNEFLLDSPIASPPKTTRNKRQPSTSLPILLGVFLASVAAAASGLPLELRRLYDTTSPVPGTNGLVFGTVEPFFEPVVAGEQTLFVGRGVDPSGLQVIGLYLDRGQGTGLDVVIDSSHLIPGSTSVFTSFTRLALNGDTVVFSGGRYFTGELGVYRSVGLDLEVVADFRTPIPDQGGSLFGSFGDVAVDGGAVLFGGGPTQHFFTWHQDGMYRAEGGSIVTVVDATTPIPSSPETFDLVGELELDTDGLAFARPRLDASYNEGIYRDLGKGLTPVADMSSPIPGQVGTFSRFSRFAYDRGETAFIGFNDANVGGTYISRNGGIEVVADRATIVPGTPFTFVGMSNRMAYTRGHLAFIGFHNPPTENSLVGLYVTINDTLHRVVEVGDLLADGTVKRIELSPDGLDGDRMVFQIIFQSGRIGLYEVRLPFFADGFESGDTSSWSITTP